MIGIMHATITKNSRTRTFLYCVAITRKQSTNPDALKSAMEASVPSESERSGMPMDVDPNPTTASLAIMKKTMI
jgi:hypothetical protein